MTASCGSSAATTGATSTGSLSQRSGNLFVLLHAMEKRTGALPQTDIDIAKRRFDDSGSGWSGSPVDLRGPPAVLRRRPCTYQK